MRTSTRSRRSGPVSMCVCTGRGPADRGSHRVVYTQVHTARLIHTADGDHRLHRNPQRPPAPIDAFKGRVHRGGLALHARRADLATPVRAASPTGAPSTSMAIAITTVGNAGTPPSG